MDQRHKKKIRKKKSVKGYVLLTTVLFFIFLSSVLLFWYQREILYYLQIESSLHAHQVYQELLGVHQEIIDLLTTKERENVENLSLQIVLTELWKIRQIKNVENQRMAVVVQKQMEKEYFDFQLLYHLQKTNITQTPLLIWGDQSQKSPSVFWSTSDQQKSNEFVSNFFQRKQQEIPRNPVVGETKLLWNTNGVFIVENKGNTRLDFEIDEALQFHSLGTVELAVDFHQNVYGKYFFIYAEQGVKIISRSLDATHLQGTGKLFIRTKGEITFLNVPQDTGIFQGLGHLWAEGSGCIKASSLVQEIYWKGSLACQSVIGWEKYTLHLQHAVAEDIPPEFLWDSILFNGVKILD